MYVPNGVLQASPATEYITTFHLFIIYSLLFTSVVLKGMERKEQLVLILHGFFSSSKHFSTTVAIVYTEF